MKIALGCDHGGYELKEYIIQVLGKLGHEYEDFGCYGLESCDYPDFGSYKNAPFGSGKLQNMSVADSPASLHLQSHRLLLLLTLLSRHSYH